MKIPRQIKVGGYRYSVERPIESFVNGDTACDGLHSFTQQEIKVSQTGTTAYQNTVFLHEVCHAIIAHYCSEDCYDEEKFVEQFSKGLYQVVNDNPEIFDNLSPA